MKAPKKFKKIFLEFVFAMKTSAVVNFLLCAVTAVSLLMGAFWVNRWLEEARVLRKVVERLSADSRAAEVLVTKSEFNEQTQKIQTTLKFLEYDAKGVSLAPKYFTFYGNILQFQSLVIRFDDRFVKGGDKLKGKSAYLFMKAFVLDGAKTQEFEITKMRQVPQGYKTDEVRSEFEARLWESFWDYALDPSRRESMGIKSAQIEAPGSIFVPGTIYTLSIEHDGGLRIDTRPIPEILKGERV